MLLTVVFFFRIRCQFNFSSWILVVLSSLVFVSKRNSNPTISCRGPPKKVPLGMARFPFASPSPDPGGWNSIWPCAFWLQFCQSMVSVGDQNGSEGWHVTSGEFCKFSFVCWKPGFLPSSLLTSSNPSVACGCACGAAFRRSRWRRTR